ncbi:phage minor tail U family protein [Photobacterium atrarenae]|uniref:Phage minor tail U family protein n=1 Tax=Photobacterium atrarenae TaxID=865757 RepID=A0ABY5GJ89_9GAMM|nr:phage minor tail U family protein [Photobacterium atrarenae]UTV28998.1 phage minor tail U family protein [Photobacterium atrarenae]
MDINNRIREQVLADLEAGMNSGGTSLIRSFHNGLPLFLAVPEPNSFDDDGDVPALAVSIAEGTPSGDSFDDITWQATMTVRIYLQASNVVDQSLDEIGQSVLNIIDTHYDANGLLELCNRSGFDYGRDDEQPWGTLDLYFSIKYTEG